MTDESAQAREPMEQRVEDLEQQLREQAALLERALARLDTATSAPAQATNRADQPDAGPSRRALLRGGALALGAGVAGAAAIASPAAAADGDPIDIGAVNTGSSRTDLRIASTGGALGHNVLTAQDTTFGGSAIPAALAGYAAGNRVGTGVYAFTNNNVAGDTRSGYALAAGADGRGTSSRAQLYMFPSGSAPTSDAISHLRGEIVVSNDNRLWFCTADGTPGTWEEITGVRPLVTAAQSAADAAQADVDALETTVDALGPVLTLVEPTRAYDSRQAQPDPGRLGVGESRVVSVADGRDINGGAVTVPDLVPVGATAIAYNLTVAGTAGIGFLSVTPGDAVTFKASTINWSSPGLNLANAGLVKLDGDRQIKVFGGGRGSADFIIDITGYYL